jgi:hypothetical protein
MGGTAKHRSQLQHSSLPPQLELEHEGSVQLDRRMFCPRVTSNRRLLVEASDHNPACATVDAQALSERFQTSSQFGFAICVHSVTL